MNLDDLYWIGIRESELADTNHIFSGSITIFGTGKGNNYSYDKEHNYRYDYNQDNETWIDFVNEKANLILKNNPGAKFLLYYFPELGIYEENLQKHLIAVNHPSLIMLLDNKLNTREWLKDFVSMPPYATYIGKTVSYEEIHTVFPNSQEYVIQAEYSCGGSGTWLFNKTNEKKVLSSLEAFSTYTISPYFDKSISLNTHLVVYDKEILILPSSVQLISKNTEAFLYKGGDFIMYQYLSDTLKQKVYNMSQIIGKRLQETGYRGICGIDFIATKDDLYFMEINPRFQSSTFLINKAFSQNHIPVSVQDLHLDAFKNPNCSYSIPEVQIDYSFYSYSYHEELKMQLYMLWELQKKSPDTVECIDDDLNWDCNFEEDTYLFKSVFNYNIAALSPEYDCRIAPNIDVKNAKIQKKSYMDYMILLKIMLLNHGIRLGEDSKKEILKHGEPNYEEFYALDITIRNHIHISAPYLTCNSTLSPFCVQLNDKGQYCLFFWNQFLEIISIRLIDNIGENYTKNGWKYNEITYLGNDRLRVYHCAGCYFKSKNIGCRFCDIEANNKVLSLEDIKEALNAYHNLSSVRHYMIGGGSNKPDSDFNGIMAIARYIKKTEHKPIYLMSLPPLDISILASLKKSGITEVAFNLEVFDRDLAKEYMPGKGSISLKTYTSAFKEAVRLWGGTGNVRSIFIVGLESTDSLLEGIEYVCKLGVSPILSLFKPIEETPMSYLLPPSNQELLKIYLSTLKICKKYNIELGPTCSCCEDNTLKITL